jgi:hypothetical protein
MEHRKLLSPAHPIRRRYRQIAALRRIYTARCKYALPDTAIYFPAGGLGDDLLLTAIARTLCSRTGKPVWVLSRHPELFAGSSDVSYVLPPTEETAALLDKLGVRVVKPTYTENLDSGARHSAPREHIIATMVRAAGLYGKVELRPWLQLSPAELAAAKLPHQAIVLQSSGLSARFPIRNKEWFPARLAEVAARLCSAHALIQIGSPLDPAIPRTHDLRGRTNVRHAAALLAQARLFIGLVGFPMHLARAVACPSVIIYGGREAPWQSGYAENTNLYRALPCSPCWLVDRCDFHRRCMDEIDAQEVIGAVNDALARPRVPLGVESVEVAPAA